MAATFQPPFRMPCEEIAGDPTISLGNPFSHALGDQTADKYVNTTVVDNWDTGIGGTITPWERPNSDSLPACASTPTCDSSHPTCGDWPTPYADNTWSHTPGDKVDFAVAHKTGFKNVQAARSWHGSFGWTSNQIVCPVAYCDDGTPVQGSLAGTPDQTKYLTVTYDCHIRNHFDAGESAGSYVHVDKTGARTVDALSGKITDTVTTSQTNSDGTTVTSGITPTLLDDVDTDLHCTFPHFRPDADFDLLGFIAAWNSAHVTPMPALTDPNSYSCSITSADPDGPWTVVCTFSRNATVVSWHFTAHQNDPGDGEDNTFEYYGTITLSDTNTAANVKADLENNLMVLVPLNDDKFYPWRTDSKVSIAPYLSRRELDNTTPIGWGPQTIDASIDGSIIGTFKPSGYQNYFDFGFADQRGCCYRPGDGSQNWAWYKFGSGMWLTDFNTATGSQLPLNCTQWNNWFQSINKPPGAWMFYIDKADYFPASCVSTSGHSGAGDAGKFVAQKWAEILDLWSSENFALPAGDMKFFYDETRVYCATNVSGSGAGSVWALIDPTTGLAPITGPDPDFYWGGPSVGGFYAIAGWDGTNVTLGAKHYDVPSNWASKSKPAGSGDDATCFGPLRWDTSPALLGRAAITTSSTTATFAVAQPAFGMLTATHQEQVDLYDASMSAVATNITATRVNDTSYTTSSSYPTAVWVQIHGSSKYYVNDTAPKGDFVKLEWTSDLRSAAEYSRLTGQLDCDGDQVTRPTTNTGGGPLDAPFGSFSQTQCCLPFTPCAPKVVCLTPNSEAFPNGKTYAFPGTFLMDELYGSKWWGYVQATMTELFWQPPHKPCNVESPFDWLMDDGTCLPDAADDLPPTYYYAHAPQVEARLAVPSNSDTCSHAYGTNQDESGPALPDGIQIGWLSPVTNTEGEIALPPTPPGVEETDGKPNSAATAWDLHTKLCASIADACRFGYTLPGC